MGKLSLKIVEATIAQSALPQATCKNTYQSYISIVYNSQIFKTSAAQGNVPNSNPLWNHLLSDIDVLDSSDSIFVSVFASPLGASQFKSIGTAQVKMEIFTKSANEEGGIVRRDGWIDLP